MKTTIAILLALIIALAAVGPATATLQVNKFTNDFSVTSPYDGQFKACSCETRADRLLVTNTGNFRTSYDVDVIADQPWYKVDTQTFTLAPGEQRELVVYVEPPCGATGSYQYSVRIASSYGRERIVTRTLGLEKCENVFLTVTGGANETNLCQPLTYGITLKNVAEFADTFSLDFGSFNDYADLAQRSFYLVPDQVKRLNVTITPPCSLYGDVQLPFTVTSAKNRVTERRTADVSIRNEFDHRIGIDTQTEVCSRIRSQYTFNVTNLIDVPNTYDVVVSGPGFLDYAPKSLALDGDQTKNVTLTLDPKKGQEGAYSVKVKVDSKLGDIKKSRQMELDVFDCFAYTVGFVGLPQDATGAYADQACCGEKEYTLNIRNSGQTEEVYRITTDGPSWFAPEEETIRLQPSENRNVRFDAQLPCTDQTYEIPVTVSLVKHPEITETVRFAVGSQTQQTCHAVALATQSLKLDEEATMVPFLVRATGLEGGTYRVTLDGALYNGTLEKEVNLVPGEEAVVHLVPKTNVSDYFDGRYLGTLTLTHEGLGLAYSQPFWTRFSHTSPLVTAWRAVRDYDYGALPPCIWLAALLLIAAVAAVVWLVMLLARKRRYAWLGDGALLALRVALAALVVLALVLLFTAPLPPRAALYEQPNATVTGPAFQWYENGRYTVDLSQYFHDPDQDWLEYTATQPAHVAVTISGSVATLIPERNWAGDDTIVFSASDQKGGVTDSPAIALRVLRRKHLTFGQWLVRYCTQVNLALLALLLAALCAVAFLAMRPAKRVPIATVLEPPKRPKGRAVRTVVSKDGAVRKLGEKPKRRSARKKARVRPGQELVATTSEGEKRVIGVAERVEWPEPKSVGNVVNVAVGAAGVQEPKELVLIGAKNGSKVHDPQCIVAQRIPRKNRVAFTSKAAAAEAGYGPCKVCQAFD